MARGACNCGAVSFEIEAELTDVFVCHCSICRRFTGANGIAVVLVEKSAFRWLSGREQIAKWSKPGADWHAWFCRTCGSALPGENDAEKMFIPAGLLDAEQDRLKVAHRIWVGSKAVWDEIGDAAKQHNEGFKP